MMGQEHEAEAGIRTTLSVMGKVHACTHYHCMDYFRVLTATTTTEKEVLQISVHRHM